MSGFLRYEHKKHPLLAPGKYYGRLVNNLLIAILILVTSLVCGTIGYHYTCYSDAGWTTRLSWVDSLLNASMILSGMGPVVQPDQMTDGGKWFASGYAIFSGVVFISTVGIMLAPAAHRMLHRFHLEDEAENEKP
ncbi:MAG TPA: hypothetical protein PKL15_07065 [Saprospiraceae bacterium]|nr:hypothetical protein [Saprospiraceae bacterium]HNM25172.1 hypothetical protein [Saprospiraceae bacterium]